MKESKIPSGIRTYSGEGQVPVGHRRTFCLSKLEKAKKYENQNGELELE
jgi:hypothetical protein